MKGDHSIEPRSVAFRKKRERGWQELESMVEQVEKKAAELDAAAAAAASEADPVG
mgnify:CR=1 FL=1